MRSLFVLSLACAIVVPAACTGGDGQDSSETAHPTTVASNFDPTRKAPAPDLDGAARGGVVTVRASDGATTMDPTEAYYTNTASILSGLVTRSLTQWVYDSERDTMVLIPDIGTDLGRPNDDFTEWTYTIRPGVKFENGTEVTADDVAYGIKRSFDRETFPTGPSYSNDYFLHGDTYQGPYLTGTDYDGVVVNGNTITLKMAKPFPDMPYWGAFPAISPIPQEGSNPESYRLHPMATGPYKFAAFKPGTSLTLVRNPHWDRDTDPGRHDYPDRYEFHFQADADKTTQAIMADEGDAQTTLSYNTPASDDLRTALSDTPDRVVQGPNTSVFMVNFDYRKITDLKVRQAIGYAFPYEEYERASGALPGVTSQPGTTLLPLGTPGRVDYNPLETEAGTTDPDKARALLEEAGYQPGQFPLSWPYDASNPTARRQLGVLTAAFEAAGFAADPYKTTNFDTWSAVSRAPDAPVNLRFAGYISDWPSGSGSVLPVLSTRGPTPDQFYTYFDEPTVDAEIDRIAELPLDQQPAAWGALDERIETEFYPILVAYYGRDAMLHGSRIGGMNNDAVIAMPTWKDIYVLR